MPVTERKGEGKMEVTTCDLERHTFFCLEMDFLDRTNERRKRNGEERERRHSGFFIAGGHVANLSEGREEIVVLSSAFAFCFCFAFPRDGHKMVLYPNQVRGLFVCLFDVAFCSFFFPLYSDSEGYDSGGCLREPSC